MSSLQLHRFHFLTKKINSYKLTNSSQLKLRSGSVSQDVTWWKKGKYMILVTPRTWWHL